MAVNLIRSIRDRQPNTMALLAGKYKRAAFAYLPSVSRFQTLNGLNLVRHGEPVFTAKSAGIEVHAEGETRQRFDVPLTYADNTLSEATLIVIQRIPSASVFSGWHHIQTDTTNSHMPYGGDVYLSTFSSSRWIGPAPLPPGYDKLHACVVVANGESRAVYMVDRLLGTGTADANVRFTTWSIGNAEATYTLSAETYGVVLLPWAVSGSEAYSLMENPWQIFEPKTIPLFFSTAANQFLSPSSDVSNSGWTPSYGSDLFAMLDEAVASDTDYISATQAGAVCELQFPSGGAANINGSTLRYRLQSGQGSVTVVLKQGAMTLQTFGPHVLTASAQDVAQTITATTTTLNDLRVELTTS